MQTTLGGGNASVNYFVFYPLDYDTCSMINSLISYHRLEINFSFLCGLKIVFLKGSVLVLLLSFLMLIFLTIVAMWFF